jgi:hypothetical protein
MTEKGIDHTLSEAKNGHTIPFDFIENYVVSFYSDAFSFTE